jgi:hypothetical protein
MKKFSLLSLLLVVGCGNSITAQSGAAACITANGCGILTVGVSACTQVIQLINDPAVAAAQS